MNERRAEQEMPGLGITEREWSRAGQTGEWVVVPGPAKPTRFVLLSSLQRLGVVRDGLAVREVFTDGNVELLVSRDRLAGGDVGVTVERDGELEIVGWATPVAKGSFAARPREERL